MASSDRTSVQQAAEEMDLGSVLVRRWIGCWVDFIVLAAFVVVPPLVTNSVMGVRPELAQIAMAAGAVAALLYFPVLEGFWGRTLGKLITGLVIVDKDGRMPGLGRAIARTLLRLIEVNPFLAGGIPAGIAVLCTKRKRRLGDLAADTYVLDADRVAQIAHVDSVLAASSS
ncbi:MAG: RDD family protein [Terricaulis sp.]